MEVKPKAHPEPVVASPVFAVPVVDKGKRKMTDGEIATGEKRARVESAAPRRWCSNWDVWEGDSLFQLNKGGRWPNIGAFDAFVLPRDWDLLDKADVEESLGTAMIHIARGLVFFASGTSQASELVEDYRKLEMATQKANSAAKEAIGRCESLQKKVDKRGHRIKKLEEEKKGLVGEKDALAKQLKDLQDKYKADMEKIATDAVVKFKDGDDFKQAVEDASNDKFTEGYEACLAFAEEKGMYWASIQLSDYADAAAAKENVEDTSGKAAAEKVEDEPTVADPDENVDVVV